MRIQVNNPIVGGKNVAAYNVAIVNELKRATKALRTQQWRFIVEEYDKSSKLLFRFDVSPEAGGGDECAEAKIRTLLKFPEIANTGELYDPNLTREENIAKLKRDGGDGLVFHYGGIRLCQTNYNLSDSQGNIPEPSHSQLLCAFSGADEKIDTLIALDIALIINDKFKELNPGIYCDCDFTALAANSISSWALDIVTKGCIVVAD